MALSRGRSAAFRVAPAGVTAPASIILLVRSGATDTSLGPLQHQGEHDEHDERDNRDGTTDDRPQVLAPSTRLVRGVDTDLQRSLEPGAAVPAGQQFAVASTLRLVAAGNLPPTTHRVLRPALRL